MPAVFAVIGVWGFLEFGGIGKLLGDFKMDGEKERYNFRMHIKKFHGGKKNWEFKITPPPAGTHKWEDMGKTLKCQHVTPTKDMTFNESLSRKVNPYYLRKNHSIGHVLSVDGKKGRVQVLWVRYSRDSRVWRNCKRTELVTEGQKARVSWVSYSDLAYATSDSTNDAQTPETVAEIKCEHKLQNCFKKEEKRQQQPQPQLTKTQMRKEAKKLFQELFKEVKGLKDVVQVLKLDDFKVSQCNSNLGDDDKYYAEVEQWVELIEKYDSKLKQRLYIKKKRDGITRL